jgi:hypothetical protein
MSQNLQSQNFSTKKNTEDELLETLLKKYQYSKGITVYRNGFRFNVFSTNIRSNERLYVVESGIIGLKKDYKILYSLDREFSNRVVSVYNDHPLRQGLQLVTTIEVKIADEIFDIAKYSVRSLNRLADSI